jgi:hypothetical protein
LWEYINRSHTHECGNWDVAAQFLFWEYLLQIFGIVSLQFASKNDMGQRLTVSVGWDCSMVEIRKCIFFTFLREFGKNELNIFSERSFFPLVINFFNTILTKNEKCLMSYQNFALKAKTNFTHTVPTRRRSIASKNAYRDWHGNKAF